jgi:hypothetical protein
MSTDQARSEGLDKLQVIAARALDDNSYRKDLISDPVAALTQEGLEVPPGVRIVVHESTTQEIHLVLPPGRSKGGQLDVDETNMVELAFWMQF